jgi:hypothetical protein
VTPVLVDGLRIPRASPGRARPIAEVSWRSIAPMLEAEREPLDARWVCPGGKTSSAASFFGYAFTVT